MRSREWARHVRGMDRRAFLKQSALAAGVMLGPSLAACSTAGGGAGGGATGEAITETAAGRVRGLLDNGVYSFKGMPYGASTTGPGRFMPPMKPAPWTAVRDALEYGPRSPQIRAEGNQLIPATVPLNPGEPMSEDCLRLNVWTPAVSDGTRRPVMVWFHGGGYSRGSGSWDNYDGTALAQKKDVVAVTVNHRLNIFGFLHLSEIGGQRYAESSNVGMKDLVAALEWVRDNIENFGGDPSNVTIMGQSGGAGKVSTLMGMPAARGLFHKAIVMSGSAVRSGSVSDAAAGAESVLHNLGLDRSRIGEIENVPVDQLLNLTITPGGVPFRLGPVADGSSLPTHVFDPVASELCANIPLLIGSTETEVTWDADMNYDELDEAGLRRRLQETLRVDAPTAEGVATVYRKNRPEASNLELYLIAASDAGGARLGTDLQAERKTMQGGAPVYRYYFQWYSPVSGGTIRAAHTMDIPFALDTASRSASMVGTGPDVQPLADTMSAAWAAFARTGDPNSEMLPDWPAFDLDSRSTMIFNSECRQVNDPFSEERQVIASALANRRPREA